MPNPRFHAMEARCFLVRFRSWPTSRIFGRGELSLLAATAGVNLSNFPFHFVFSRLRGLKRHGGRRGATQHPLREGCTDWRRPAGRYSAVFGPEMEGQWFSLG
jgi:hypothetical protein